MEGAKLYLETMSFGKCSRVVHVYGFEISISRDFLINTNIKNVKSMHRRGLFMAMMDLRTQVRLVNKICSSS